VKGRDGTEATRVFVRPSGAGGQRRPGGRGRGRSGRGARTAAGGGNPFARPGLFLAVVATTFLFGLLLGFILGLKGY